jgi:hypothetical protein
MYTPRRSAQPHRRFATSGVGIALNARSAGVPRIDGCRLAIGRRRVSSSAESAVASDSPGLLRREPERALPVPPEPVHLVPDPVRHP